jgi:beta-mannanase
MIEGPAIEMIGRRLNAGANETFAPSRDWEYRDGASQDPAADEAYRRMQSAIAIRAT